ncbi:MAG: Asp-tRNA(Asn)/Glu-tRNA(Gln) amidotransferase subunit GatA [Acidobacteria bacterium]|nr:Asp-tRNA(Asn)/Glu-tRNA(Gln) amidotransferase subunit GatA [Acidobacteriota bacterium]
MDLTTLTIAGLHAQLRARAVTARQVVEKHFERIQERNPKLKAYLTLSPERALAQAEAIDRRIQAGDPLPPLAGVPMAIKDVIVTRGVPSTAGSRILENYRPPYDATAVTRLEQAGAVILGKTNCDEFAMGSSTENSAYFPTCNPHDLARVPGGSSGGSAAAVADGLAVAALGSDTGGSIRQPAGFCGVAGLMGTYGRVSRYGLIAFASSLDHIGPLARTVRDVVAVLQVIAGRDPLDSTSADVSVPDYLAALDKPVKGLRLGVPKEYFGAGLDPEVRTKLEKGIERFRKLGCEVRELSLPHTDYAIACYYIIATAEASSNLARYDGVRYAFRAPGAATLEGMYQATRGRGFGAEVKRRIMLGTYALSAGYYEAYYLKAQKVRTLLYQDFVRAFSPDSGEHVDALVTPTSPTPAFKLGEKTADPLQMYLADIYTVTGDLVGVPGISVPCGKSKAGLPIGLQLFTRHFDEARLLQLAHAFEQSGGFTL